MIQTPYRTSVLSLDAKLQTMFIPRRLLEEKLLKFLADDVGEGDVTTAAVVPPKRNVDATVIAKADGTIAGVQEVAILAEAVGLKVSEQVAEGTQVKNNQVIMKLQGDSATILTVERTLLNLLSRMSGIATATRSLTIKIQLAKLKTKIAATRKSAPGLLYFDKKAVAIGGGDPHRVHLDDMILIKDNHIVAAGGLVNALKATKSNASFSKKIEVEITHKIDALKAAQFGVDIIMLDNFSPGQIGETIDLLSKVGYKGLIEASGGITAENLLEYAATGVDLISLGALTHSVKALDISLEITPPK
jgi:nicotinate-nucleotide pyrophosphorylase (carboxylating)